MNEENAKILILEYFPAVVVKKITKIGEGLGNIAFEVNNDLIFRFPKNEKSKEQLGREIPSLKLINKHATLPVPDFIYIAPDNSLVGYKKLIGTALLYERSLYPNWQSFSRQIGRFLTAIHSIPYQELKTSHLLAKTSSVEECLNEGHEFFEKVRRVIPHKYILLIESFFQARHPSVSIDSVLCHNDFGIEHILINNGKVSGIIDWSGAAITDPAQDFGRLYRDLEVKLVDQILDEYSASTVKKNIIRERAIFYGKCLSFQDIYYGLENQQSEYSDKSLKSLEWMFPVL
ncbi:MAG: aminoglycoside phosphotransferase family protein [bacterium]|nr:aminoglycoside phosphotransferase family protein [bacterium]